MRENLANIQVYIDDKSITVLKETPAYEVRKLNFPTLHDKYLTKVKDLTRDQDIYLLGKGGYVFGSAALFVCLSFCQSICLSVC